MKIYVVIRDAITDLDGFVIMHAAVVGVYDSKKLAEDDIKQDSLKSSLFHESDYIIEESEV